MLEKIFNDDARLKSPYRQLVMAALVVYALMIAVMCFSPQVWISSVTTPNIWYLGRLRLLLVPFNSLVSLSQLSTVWEVVWVIGQNILNIFLLYPLGFCFYLLWERWSSPLKALQLGFSISITIEVTQLVLDWLFDFNRVFELDDLWTNALGVWLAYWSVAWVKKKRLSSKRHLE